MEMHDGRAGMVAATSDVVPSGFEGGSRRSQELRVCSGHRGQRRAAPGPLTHNAGSRTSL